MAISRLIGCLLMDNKTFNIKYEKLTPRQKEVLIPFLSGKTDQDIASKLHCGRENIRYHLANIFRVFDLSDVSGNRCRNDLIDLFVEHRKDLVSFDCAEQAGYRTSPVPAMAPDIPGRPMALQSPFYSQPNFIDRSYEEVLIPGQLIRIRSPHTTGKTSLLYRILNHARGAGYRTVTCNLRYDLDTSDLDNLAKFLSWFCQTVAQSLALPIQELPTTKQACTRYLQSQILLESNASLVIALDEAEILFEYPTIARDFFALLRGWHEYASTPGLEGVWGKLRLIIAHSTDDYIRLNTAQSPFANVGYVTKLLPLQADQIQVLANLYGLRWSGYSEVKCLMSLVGGHPYLIQQALYSLWKQETTFEELLVNAPTLSGIYRSHLLDLSNRLQAMSHASLMTALMQVIDDKIQVRLSGEQTFKLEGLGLIQLRGNQPSVSCELYRQFFQDMNKVS
jgi:DNA-binding CsgD family transcriptional regulator